LAAFKGDFFSEGIRQFLTKFFKGVFILDSLFIIHTS